MAKRDPPLEETIPLFNTMKGIVLQNGNIVYGKILSKNVDTVKIKTGKE